MDKDRASLVAYWIAMHPPLCVKDIDDHCSRLSLSEGSGPLADKP